MSNKKSLTCLEKRNLLNQPTVPPETLLQWGRHYEERGLIHDAVDFYAKANTEEELTRLLEVALEDGDLFLFRRLCRVLEHEPTAEQWLFLATRAEKAGKYSFAAEAYRQKGDEEQTARIEALLSF